MPITDIMQSLSKTLPNFLALGLSVRSIVRSTTPIGRTRPCSLFYKDFITGEPGKQLSSCFGLIMADLLMQGEMLHNRVA